MLKVNQIIHGVACEHLIQIPNATVDLIVTDTPYGINYKSNKQNCDTRGTSTIVKDRPQYFDSIDGDNFVPVEWLSQAYRVLKNGSALYIFCHWSRWHILYPEVEKAGFKCKNMIVLNKSNHGMGDLKGQYAPKHELILFATKGRHILKFPVKRLNDIWNVPVRFSGSKRLHPNEKPVSWIEPCIINSSQKEDLVLDPFAGSGSTGVAAKNLNRNFLLIEVDEEYYNIAKNRIQTTKKRKMKEIF